MPKKPGKALKRKSRMPVGFICVCVLPALLLTLFFIVIAIIAAAVMYLLWVQVITFIQDVALEVAYRVQQA